MLVIFSFTLNTDTGEVAYAGTIDPVPALKLLQDIVVTDAATKMVEAKQKEDAAKTAEGATIAPVVDEGVRNATELKAKESAGGSPGTDD